MVHEGAVSSLHGPIILHEACLVLAGGVRRQNGTTAMHKAFNQQGRMDWGQFQSSRTQSLVGMVPGSA